MKYVKASRLTYDANIGRVEPGETYWVEDDKADRWINAGIATAASKPPEPVPEPEPAPAEEEENEEEEEEEAAEHLVAEVKKLSDEGDSQRMIAEKLGISRDRVRRMLAAA